MMKNGFNEALFDMYGKKLADVTVSTGREGLNHQLSSNLIPSNQSKFMNNNYLCGAFLNKKSSNKHIVRVMKITSFLLFFSFFCLSAANLNSQNVQVTLNKQNVRLENVLIEIEKQTDYLFVYDKKVDTNQTVSINVSQKKLKETLDELLERLNISFSTEGSNIILSTKEVRETQTTQQEKKITGVVKSAEGESVIGASVVVKGTSTGVLTGLDGGFSLAVPANATTLVVSYVGMKTQEVTIKEGKTYAITMENDMVAMDEVVITALGIKKEAKSLSYNVQQMSGNDINKVSDANFINNLNGKIAGATINSSSSGIGGSSRVVMRGVKSISGNNNALYVIDGIPMPNLSTDQPADIFSGAGQTGDGISNINPDDIESISVLSGPSASALYGSSASNGVILVTTKKGKEGTLSINVANSTTFSTPLLLPEFQNTYKQTGLGSYDSWGDKLATSSSYNPADFFQTSVNVTNSINLSTGTEQNQTYVSFGTVNAEGIIHNNDFSRYNFSVRNTSKFLKDKLTMDISFMTSYVKEENMLAQGQYFNPLVPVYLFPPGDDFSKVQIYKRYNASRNFQTQFWPHGDNGMLMQNPYWITEEDQFISHKERYMTNLTLKYEFADWINLSGRFKMDKSNDAFEKKFGASTNTLFASDAGFYSLNERSTRQIYGEALLNINRYFHDQMFNLTANVGTSFEHTQYDQNMYGGKLHGVPNLFTFTNINPADEERSQTGHRKQKQSVFASAQFGYKSMVYLDATARNDWPSTLAGADMSSFFYPSIGLSGIITDIFKIDTPIMPYMKLRVSYAEVGNEPDLFLTIPTYEVVSGYPVTQTRMPNTNLKPERTESWEVGANFMFLKGKLKLDATFYKSSTFNQFFEPTLSSASGYTSVVVNAGRVDNKGLEISARYSDTFGKFNWSTYLTYSLNRNKVKTLLAEWENPVTHEVISLSELDMGGTGSYKMVLKEGGSMGDIYVNTLRTDEHGAIYVHPSDYTVIAENNKFIYAGSANPKYNLSWGNNFSWKGLSLGFLLTARVGGIVVSNTQAIMDAFGVSKASADARDRGGALVNGKLIPSKEYYQIVGDVATGGIGSMYTYSATNVRLGELSLGYDVPIKNWVNAIKGLNVSFVGHNLFFLYHKAPYDPELTANTGTYFQGVDYFMAPSLRNLGFSVKLQF
jgi:TonB-linked SusC/RagA family outer membrane protein